MVSKFAQIFCSQLVPVQLNQSYTIHALKASAIIDLK